MSDAQKRSSCANYERLLMIEYQIADKNFDSMRKKSPHIPHVHPILTCKTHVQPSSYSALIPKILAPYIVCFHRCRQATRHRTAGDNSLTALLSCKPFTWRRKDTISSFRGRSLKLGHKLIFGRFLCRGGREAALPRSSAYAISAHWSRGRI